MATFDCTLGHLVDDAPVEPLSLEDRRAALWARVKAIRASREIAGALTPSGRVQTDPASIAKINGMVSAAFAAQLATMTTPDGDGDGDGEGMMPGNPFSLQFALEDNSVVELDGPATIALGLAVAAYIAALYDHSFTLRAAIEAATDDAALDAIDIEGGWPA